MYIFTVTTIMAIFISFFVKVHPDAERRAKKKQADQAP